MNFNDMVSTWYSWLSSLNNALVEPINRLSDGLGIPLISAFLFGLLGTTAPCQLSTNFGALAFLTRRANQRTATLRATLAYIVAKTLVYTAIGLLVLVVGRQVGNAIVPYVVWIRKIIGPLMIVLGLIVLGVIRMRFQLGQRLSRQLEQQAESIDANEVTPERELARQQYALAQAPGGAGMVALSANTAPSATAVSTATTAVVAPGARSSFLLGIAFGLAFCPTLFILFFGATMSLALRSAQGALFPAAFALGTVMPLALLVGVALVSSGAARRLRKGLRRANRPLRWLAGAVLILVGLHDTIVYWLL